MKDGDTRERMKKMGCQDYQSQYSKICCWCGLVSYLGIGMSYDEFSAALKKAKNKTRFKKEFVKQCQAAVRDYIREFGYAAFAVEVEKYHQTLTSKNKKHHPDTYAMWAGIYTDGYTLEKARKEKNIDFRTMCSDFDDTCISYDPWFKHR